MSVDLTATVEALRWIVGTSPAVEALMGVEAYVNKVEKERDAALAAEAAARAALEKAQADAAAMASKLNGIVADLADGVFDGVLPLELPPAPIDEVVAAPV
jgi:hypothetical protein